MKSPEQIGKNVVRGILAFAVGTTGVGVFMPEGSVKADQGAPCVKVGLEPDTIRNNGIDNTVLGVEVLPACRSDLLRVEGKFDANIFNVEGGMPGSAAIGVQLKDDGTGEDKIAGDFIFTSGKIRTKPHIPLSQWETPYEGINDLYVLTAAQVQLVYSDGTVRMRRNLQLFLLNETVPLINPTVRSITIQTSPHVVNMSDQFSAAAQYLRGMNVEQDIRLLTNQLYNLALGTDPYHFLVMTNDKQIFLPEPNSRNGWAGTYRSLRRDFSGTGGTSYFDTDVAGLFGSQGNLRHIIFEREPLSLLTLLHETDHLPNIDLVESLGLNTGRHFKDNHSSGGLVGGTTWIDNRDGTFTSLGYSHQFMKMSKLEQYLWGWIRPDQVPPIYVALNENQPFWQAGAIIHGPFKTVTIQDIIAQHGVRTPGPDTALRNFKIGYVYTTTGRLATATEMTARELLAQRLPTLWSQATDGLSTMEFVTPLEPGPAIIEPFAGKTLDSLGATLKFIPRADIKQFHIQVVPYNNDGPAINLIIGAQELVQSGRFNLLAPEFGKGNYVMLPGMSYTWRIRTTSSTNPNIKEDDPSWSAWSKDTFRTPNPSSATIEPVTQNGTKLDSLNPTFQWKDNNTQMFYYEVQVSKDPNFNTDPATATAAVYWVLRHGGVTNPPNSFTIPPNFPLEPSTKYYWRVRQRVQGDGTPINWSPPWSVEISQTATTQTAIVLHQKDDGEIDWGKMQTDHWRAIKEEFVP